jgi:hypothetical protein
MTFHRPYEVALGVSRKKLAMNNVNVFAGVKNHKLMELCFGCSHQRLGPRNPVFKNSGNIDIRLTTGGCNGRRSFARAVVQPQPYSRRCVVPISFSSY